MSSDVLAPDHPARAGLVTDVRHLLADEAPAPGVLAPAGDLPADVGAVAVLDTWLPLLRGVDTPLSVVTSGGSGQIDGALGLAQRLGLRVVSVRTALRDLDDPAGNARRVVAAAGGTDVPVTVVVPTAAGRGAAGALDELASADLALGLVVDRTVTDGGWTTLLDEALDRELGVELVASAGALPPSPLAALGAVRAVLDGERDRALALASAGDDAAVLDAYDADTLARTRRLLLRVDAVRGA